MKFAEVILPLPLANTFTYRIPEDMTPIIRNYCRVVAPFGKKLHYIGVVIEIHDRCPEQDYEVKELIQLVDEKPVIRNTQLLFWQWVSSYCLCTLGEVCRAALPIGLKMGKISETRKKEYKPKTETCLRLADRILTVSDLENERAGLKRTKQQEKLLLVFLELSGIATYGKKDNDEDHLPANQLVKKSAKTVFKKNLLAYSGLSASILNGLLQRGILVSEEIIISRIEKSDAGVQQETALSQAQLIALDEIKKSFEAKEVTLLHSIASNGKTELFIRLIQETMSKGLQALYLLPEIALTTQITERLKQVFGSKLLVYNSGISDNKRVEIWNYLLKSDEPVVVLGVRSSVFLPFARLGLVVVGEEHDSSYKQQEPSPRYHARNAGLMLAHQHGAKTLLGSATPSLETWLWTKNGKYGYVAFNERNGDSLAPAIEIVNVSDLRRKKRMRDTLFSPLLKEKIEKALSQGDQVVLFQNRRGFAPLITCRQCGMIPHCVNCDVSMTFHKQLHRLICHYCGYSTPFPLPCPSCGHEESKMQGFGTEKIEEEVAALFPSAKVARLDLDTARTESAQRRILSDFEEGKTQLLIGTQLIAKGLNFSNVRVVGILNVDSLMNIPDFRAYERAFQLIYQVSGCASGRSDRSGYVVIQTSQDETPFFQFVRRLDYSGMAQMQLKERHQFHYPPYTRLIMLVLRCSNEQVLDKIAEIYAERLKARLGSGVSGPVLPPLLRVQTLFVRKIMIKTELFLPVSETRNALEEVHVGIKQHPLYKQIILHYDVDPQ